MGLILKTLAGLGGLTVAILTASELTSLNRWWARRKELYEMALAEAQRMGRPLLVVGRPRFRDHG